MRKFIRHPVDIPIEVRVTRPATAGESFGTSNIGLGGLAFRFEHNVDAGALVHIRIGHIQPAFEADARVVWCHQLASGSEVGVEFLNADDAFKARMVEQVCHIENYRQSVSRNEGRKLTSQEAAIEWIDKHAANFPG